MVVLSERRRFGGGGSLMGWEKMMLVCFFGLQDNVGFNFVLRFIERK